MSARFLLALISFVVIVGSGTLWLFYNILKRKNLLQNLLSLPKERRFFWYKLRRAQFQIISHNLIRNFTISIDNQPKTYSLKADFLVKKKGKRLIGLFAEEIEEKEFLKILYVYCHIFKTKGVIFYHEDTKSFTIWEK